MLKAKRKKNRQPSLSAPNVGTSNSTSTKTSVPTVEKHSSPENQLFLLLSGAKAAEQSTPQEKPIAKPANGQYHDCYAELPSGNRCSESIPLTLLMCANHWRMVPKRIQALVYQHYQNDQTSLAYRHAAQAARQAVKERLCELQQAGPRANCPFCLDKGIADEDRASGKYCGCTAGQIRFKKERFQQRPLRKKGEKVYDSVPFGKFKGIPFAEVPIDYLQWAYENWDDKEDGLYSSIANALYNRLEEVET